MYKFLHMLSTVAVLSCTMAFTTQTFADTLDAATIAFIHSKTKSSLIDLCKKKMTDMTPAVCSCLAEKAQAGLDDNALKLCSADASGQNCIEQAVEKSTVAALSKDNVKACTDANPVAAPATAAN